MDSKLRILAEIMEVTINIETDYPELYRFLEEDPITIPATASPDMDRKTLEEYLESLRQLLKHHRETHKTESS